MQFDKSWIKHYFIPDLLKLVDWNPELKINPFVCLSRNKPNPKVPCSIVRKEDSHLEWNKVELSSALWWKWDLGIVNSCLYKQKGTTVREAGRQNKHAKMHGYSCCYIWEDDWTCLTVKCAFSLCLVLGGIHSLLGTLKCLTTRSPFSQASCKVFQ